MLHGKSPSRYALIVTIAAMWGMLVGICGATSLAADSGLFIRHKEHVYRLVGVCVSREGGPDEWKAAREFARCAEELTGASLSVRSVGASEPVADGEVLIGSLGQQRGWVSSDELACLAYGGVQIRIQASGLALCGFDGRGTLDGVYRYFNSLGVRFPSPEIAEIFPGQKAHFLVPGEMTIRPAFRLTARVRSKIGDPRQTCEARLYQGIYWDHTADVMVPYATYGKTHPEYYALIPQPNGELTRLTRSIGWLRRRSRRSAWVHLCMSNPQVQKIAIENVLAWIGQQPDQEWFFITPGDGPDWCRCPQCKAMDPIPGKYTDRYLAFVNVIARAVGQQYPNKRLVALAYTPNTEAPPVREVPEPNVIVCFSPYCYGGAKSQNHSLQELPNKEALEHFLGWRKKLGDREMFAIAYPVLYPLPFYPLPCLLASAADMKFYAAHNVTWVWHYGEPTSFRELFRYLMRELQWNPNVNVDQEIDTFMAAWFGSAGPFMRGYFDDLHQTVQTKPHIQSCEGKLRSGLFANGLAQRNYRRFEKAQKAVGEDPIRLKRVLKEKQYFLFGSLTDEILSRNPGMDQKTIRKHAGELLCLLVKNAEQGKQPILRFGRGGGWSVAEWVERAAKVKLTRSPWWEDPLAQQLMNGSSDGSP